MNVATMRSDGLVMVAKRVAAAPGEVVLLPWGLVESENGAFKVTDGSGMAILQAFADKGLKLAIDFEHQSLGGQYSSPDGTAPAAGWLTDLQSRPGKGIVGQVEWTDRAAQLIAKREYRYLSPVVTLDPKTHEVLDLLSVALTNYPAIHRFPALVNKAPIFVNRTEFNMKDVIGKIADALAALAEMPSGLVPEGVLPNLESALQQLKANTGDTETVTTAESALRQENRQLQTRIREDQFNLVIARHRGKMPPAQIESFKAWWLRDAVGAEGFLQSCPTLVSTQPIASGAGTSRPPVSGSRHLVIARGKSEFQAECANGKVVCSESAFVNLALRDAGLPRLSEADERAYSIGCETRVA